jgi:hypothetical protein
MRTEIHTPNTSTRDLLLASLATLIGLVVRLAAPLSVSFPLNDGGLFYQMILDLQANQFRLPAFTTYNAADIPFAYPPFAFYFTGLLSTAFHLNLLTLLRILPPIISSLSIPAFYFLARQIIKSRQETALAAALAFALVPRGFEWLIMGGGITRTFGLLFALLTLRAAFVLYHEHTHRSLFAVIGFGTLTVLSHPEASAQTALAAVLFYLVIDRSLKGAFYSFLAAAGILILAAPWWATVVSRHGLFPFLAIINAAREGTIITFGGRVFLSIQFKFTDEPYLPLIAVIGLVGLFAKLEKSDFLLPLWVTVPLFVEPRSAPQYMVVPLAMLAGIGLVEVILPALKYIGKGLPNASQWAASAMVAYLFVYCLVSAYIVCFGLTNSAMLTTEGRQAFDWVRTHTPVDSRFVILSNGGPLSDPISEWFPAITGRTSLNTVFGTEWLRDESLRLNSTRYSDLQACFFSNPACIEAWAQKYDLRYTHILIRRQMIPTSLIAQLQASDDYRQIYDSQEIAVFEKVH